MEEVYNFFVYRSGDKFHLGVKVNDVYYNYHQWSWSIIPHLAIVSWWNVDINNQYLHIIHMDDGIWLQNIDITTDLIIRSQIYGNIGDITYQEIFKPIGADWDAYHIKKVKNIINNVYQPPNVTPISWSSILLSPAGIIYTGWPVLSTDVDHPLIQSLNEYNYTIQDYYTKFGLKSTNPINLYHIQQPDSNLTLMDRFLLSYYKNMDASKFQYDEQLAAASLMNADQSELGVIINSIGSTPGPKEYRQQLAVPPGFKGEHNYPIKFKYSLEPELPSWTAMQFPELDTIKSVNEDKIIISNSEPLWLPNMVKEQIIQKDNSPTSEQDDFSLPCPMPEPITVNNLSNILPNYEPPTSENNLPELPELLEELSHLNKLNLPSVPLPLKIGMYQGVSQDSVAKMNVQDYEVNTYYNFPDRQLITFWSGDKPYYSIIPK